MPGVEVAPRFQPATHFSFADIASAHGIAVGPFESRIRELASSQGLTPAADFMDTAKFVLAQREQVEERSWCAELNAGVFCAALERTGSFSLWRRAKCGCGDA